MMRPAGLRALVALVLAAIWLTIGIGPALAGTTGTIRGHASDAASHAPLVGARVTAVSPSQSATATTDARGNFIFIALAPDTYTLSIETPGFNPQSLEGITVVADQAQTIALESSKTLRTIGGTSTRTSVGGLVKAGTTNDVYSVSPAKQTAAATIGGAGSIDQAYAGLAALPGVTYDLGQVGWGQNISIRGGAQTDVANELDGIPTQRFSDQASTTTLSTLGQQELQVYTGGAPASADAAGLSGYVNQVVRTGTTPGFVNASVGLGGPQYYHKLSFEFGGQTTNRNFSYYLGTAAVNQTYRFIDQNNGVSDPRFVYPLAIPTGGAGVYDGSGPAIFAPGSTGEQTYTQDRENVANFHLAVPHKGGALKDDVQLLLLESQFNATVDSSPNDLGGLGTVTSALGFAPTFVDTYVYPGALMTPLTGNETLRATQFPGGAPHRSFGQALPADSRDGNSNNVGIVKLQYQRNIDEKSYLRLFGYSTYSNWFFTGPSSANLTYGSVPADYEVQEHGYGLNLRYTNQITAKNLLTVTASYQTQKLQTLNNGANAGIVATNYVDGAGNCYTPDGSYASCFTASGAGGGFNQVSQYGVLQSPLVPCALNAAGQCAAAAAGTPAALNGARWGVTENGRTGQIDTVRPYFTAYSISDQFRPTSKLTLDLGLRFENFLYRLDDLASGYPSRAFWFAAYNREFCYAPGTTATTMRGAPDPTTGAFPACSAGTGVGLTNTLPHTTQFGELQPRTGLTYQLGGDTVLRASYGRYAGQFGSSFQEYNTIQQNLPSFLDQFVPFGYTTPYHRLVPSISNSYDASIEHRFRGTDLAFKISPFYRATRNELQGTPLGSQGIYAVLNTGNTRAYGIEFALDKGSFDRNGLAFALSYTFTASRTRFSDITPGTNYVDTLNNFVQQYNSYTRACATANARLCGMFGSANAQPTFAGTGAAAAIPNPYYDAAPQPLFDRNAEYATYQNLPAGYRADVGRITPHTASLVLNYRAGHFAVTPTATFSAGKTYGAPLVWPGYDPASCAAVGANGQADTTTCAASLFIPNVYTGKFDALGAFVQPSRLSLNLATSYDVSKRLTLRVQMTGLLDRCFQRGYAWDDKNVCDYSSLPSNALAPVGNFVPLASAPVALRYPYSYFTTFTTAGFIGSRTPFALFATLDVKL